MLGDVSKMDHWLFVNDIDIRLRHRALSRKINEACYYSSLATSPVTRSCALGLSTASAVQVTGCVWFPLQPWASIFTATTIVRALSIGWAPGLWKVIMAVHFAKVKRLQTL